MRDAGAAAVMPAGNPTPDRRPASSSQLEAARSAKRSKSAIGYAPETGTASLDRNGTQSPGGPNNGMGEPVRIGGQEWPSQSALDRALGVPVGTVSRWIKAGALDALTGAVMHMNTQRKAA